MQKSTGPISKNTTWYFSLLLNNEPYLFNVIKKDTETNIFFTFSFFFQNNK